jgi:hypothetical protein
VETGAFYEAPAEAALAGRWNRLHRRGSQLATRASEVELGNTVDSGVNTVGPVSWATDRSVADAVKHLATLTSLE